MRKVSMCHTLLPERVSVFQQKGKHDAQPKRAAACQCCNHTPTNASTLGAGALCTDTAAPTTTQLPFRTLSYIEQPQSNSAPPTPAATTFFPSAGYAPPEHSLHMSVLRNLCLPQIDSTNPAGGGDRVHNLSLTHRPNRVGDDRYLAILDTGANRHLLNQHIQLMNKRQTNLQMHAANGQTTTVTEAGDFELPCVDLDGNPIDPLLLHNASTIKHSPFNLVSVGVLCELGTTFHFEKDNSYFVYKGNTFKLEERDGLYLMRLDEILQADDLASLKRSSHNDADNFIDGTDTFGCAATYDLWHARYGFASKKRIKLLYDSATAEGLDVGAKYSHDAKCTCPTCMAINNRKVHIGDIRKHADNVTKKGQLLYTDICGPFPTSVEGYRYVISFTDVYSRFSCCYFLDKKSQAEDALRSLHQYYLREGIVIKNIRSDQGGEYGGHNERHSILGETGRSGKPFKWQRVCEELGIRHELCPAKRPELHGLAERWNLTVIGMANSMLYASRLSPILWPAAVSHANMLRNRLPLHGLGALTPYTIFFGQRPRVDTLRVWGCDAYKMLDTYPKIPGQQSRKRLLYCGETPDRLGFRCFDPITFKYTTEYELIFDETSAKKRINAIREHDIRRELARRGKLSDMALEPDDYNLDADTLALERTLFSSERSSLPADQSADQSTPVVPSPPSAESRMGETRPQTPPHPPLPPEQPLTATQGLQPSANFPAPSPQPALRPLRTGHEPSDPSNQHPNMQLDLTDQDEGDVALNDTAAAQFGPLTEPALQLERQRSTIHPAHPRRPLRHQPIGVAVEDSENFKTFRRFAFDNDVLITIVQQNPKTTGSLSHQRYERYKFATTLREFIELSTTTRGIRSAKERATARKDIVHDSLRGYIIFPQYEHNASTHFVDAQQMAHAAHVTNFHSLYSKSEACDAVRTRNASIITAALHTLQAAGEPTNPFQQLLGDLWHVDNDLSPNSTARKHAAYTAAESVALLMTGAIPEPSSYKKASHPSHPEKDEWEASMKRERDTLEDRGTWELVPKHSIGKHRPVKCKYVYKKKKNKDNSMQYKSRLVGCGYSQIPGQDYSMDQTYAGVCSYSSMRFLMSYACQQGMILAQTDITGAYLESYLDEIIYMDPPPDMYSDGKPPTDANGDEVVLLVKRGLYGLK